MIIADNCCNHIDSSFDKAKTPNDSFQGKNIEKTSHSEIRAKHRKGKGKRINNTKIRHLPGKKPKG